MKKLLGLAMAAALLVSCSDDDSSSSSVSAEKLIGKWYPTTTKITKLGNFPYENDCATAKDYTEFNANGVGTDVYYDEDCDASTANITYTLAGKTLTVNYGGDYIQVYTVKTASSSTLVLQGDYDADDDGTSEATFTTTFKK